MVPLTYKILFIVKRRQPPRCGADGEKGEITPDFMGGTACEVGRNAAPQMQPPCIAVGMGTRGAACAPNLQGSGKGEEK